MKNSNFNEWYQYIKENNKDLEKVHIEAKKEKNKKMIIGIVICILLDFFVYYFFIKPTNIASGKFTAIAFYPMAIVNIMMILVITATSKKQKEYMDMYKKKIIESLIQHFYYHI